MSLALESLPDGELATLTLAGRDAAFAEIMRRHRDAIFRLARGYTGDPDEALDITQDCFAAAYLNLARYDRVRPLRAWLSTIALNRCRDWGRKQRVRALLAFGRGSAREAETIADEAPGPGTTALGRAELALAARAIAELPAKLRVVLLLRTVEGLSQAETADVLGITIKAVETRLARARTQLGNKIPRN